MEDELSGRAFDTLRRRASLPTAAEARPTPSGAADSRRRIADIERSSLPLPAHSQRKTRVPTGRRVVNEKRGRQPPLRLPPRTFYSIV